MVQGVRWARRQGLLSADPELHGAGHESPLSLKSLVESMQAASAALLDDVLAHVALQLARSANVAPPAAIVRAAPVSCRASCSR